jgi:aspartyl-tRNA(Asn)/glutamyl-tRNA(Gln) amidotransferase subunit C
MPDDSFDADLLKVRFSSLREGKYGEVMTIDSKTVAKIANLARLKIPEADCARLAGELDKIIVWMEQLNEVDVKNVAPLASVNDASLRWREDVVNDGGKKDDILANAPASKADFFTVPKVIE